MRILSVLALALAGCQLLVGIEKTTEIDGCLTECADDDPCTLDACVEGACVHDPRPVPEITSESSGLCPGGTLTLTASESESYLWSTGETTRSISVTEAGSYTVEHAGCAVPSLAYDVVARDTSTISPQGPTTFCVGGTVNLTANQGASYLWSNGQTSREITVSTSGAYTVQVDGCAASDPVLVTVQTPLAGSTQFDFSGSLQTFTVPMCVTRVRIDASGGQGGDGGAQPGQGGVGGMGARVIGYFAVTPGDVYEVLVGGQGGNNTSDGGGGGGGSFVWRMGVSANPIIGAGGGGGGSGYKPQGETNFCPMKNGRPGVTTVDGTAGEGGGGAAGTAGNGGGTSGDGGGGGGWFSGGQPGGLGGHGGPGGGGDFAATGVGAYGGGGIPGRGGGGAGGYSGGGAGDYATVDVGGGMIDYLYCGGGGGGSYNTGTDQTNSGGVRAGAGVVVISW